MRYWILACLLVTGCAAVSESECRTSNWYERGRSDAQFGKRPNIDLYAQGCSRYQVQPSAADYLAGWAIGNSETGFRQPN